MVKVHDIVLSTHSHAVSLKQEDGFHLELEDYLHGLLTLASELVSLLQSIRSLKWVHTGLNMCHVQCTVIGYNLRFMCCD